MNLFAVCLYLSSRLNNVSRSIKIKMLREMKFSCRLLHWWAYVTSPFFKTCLIFPYLVGTYLLRLWIYSLNQWINFQPYSHGLLAFVALFIVGYNGLESDLPFTFLPKFSMRKLEKTTCHAPNNKLLFSKLFSQITVAQYPRECVLKFTMQASLRPTARSMLIHSPVFYWFYFSLFHMELYTHQPAYQQVSLSISAVPDKILPHFANIA